MVKLHFFWALFALSPLAIAQPAETPKPANTATLAYDYLTRELGSRLSVKQGKSVQPDKASSNTYSPEQMAAVRAVFGSDAPLMVKRQPVAGGLVNYSITLPAHAYQDDQSQVTWEQASMQVGVAPNGKQSVASSLPFLSVGGKGGRWDMEEMRATGTMQADYWSGKSNGELRRLSFKPAAADDPGFTIDGLRFGSDVKRQGQYYGARSELTFDQFSTHGHSLDKLHMSLRWRQLDAGAMAGLKLELDRVRAEGVDDAQAAQVFSRYIPLLKRLVLRGAAMEIDDLSASYNGQKVAIKGRLAMPHATEADFESGPAIFKKLAGQLEIAVPLGLLREVADTMARQGSSKDAARMSPEKLSAQMYEMMLGKALANNYARLDKDMLRTTIVLNDGLLTVNGTNLPLEPLLALFEEKKLPPADTEPPTAISMRDRGLEATQLFAMNGNRDGLFDLCDRMAHGIGVDKDAAQAEKWCTKAWNEGGHFAAVSLGELFLAGQLDTPGIPAKVQEAADKDEYASAQFLMYRMHSEGKGVQKDLRKGAAYLLKSANQGNGPAIAAMKQSDAAYQAPSRATEDDIDDNPWTFSAKAEAGFYKDQNYRFNTEKHRALTVSMGNPQMHEKWLPLLAVCVSAINPSDAACFNLTGHSEDRSQIVVSSNIRGTESSERTKAKYLDTAFKPGDEFNVVVYASGKQVHFVVNGDDTLVQDVNFPVEVLTLFCSTADCKFNFRQPE